MDLNQLVCKNQSIKIVPSVEDSLRSMGVNVDMDKNITIWFSQLKLKWLTWKKSTAVDYHFNNLFTITSEPFRVALICIVNCPEFKDCKLKSLPYYFLETLNEWSKTNNVPPPNDLKMPAFHVAIKQRNQNFLTLLLKTYQVNTIKDSIVPIVNEMIKNDNSKQAIQIVIALELFEDIPVEDLLYPFILQDKPNMIDEYLSQCPKQIQPLLTFLDKLLDKTFDVTNYTQSFIYKNNICHANISKVHYKPLGKLVARLCNKFNIPIESCKNLSKNRTISGLRYLIHQKYNDHNVSLTVWDDLVKDSLNKSLDCSGEFIDLLATYDTKEALKWATFFEIPENDLPLCLKNLSVEDTQAEENWDEESDQNQFYKLPLSEDKIVMVDTGDKFNELIPKLMNYNIIGIDCEWKPSFGASQSQVALIQIATHDNVYLIDTLVLNDKQFTSCWHKFNKALLENAEIIKIGFGLEQDLREVKASVIGLSNIRIKGEGLLDLALLWKSLIGSGIILPTGNISEGNSLSSLVQSCFGLPLEKSEQCSNWELRPLRNTQINYAALDAYVLIVIYEYINKVSVEQAINFDEICNNVMIDKKPKSTKKAKVIDRLNASKFNFQCRNASSVKMLLEPELSPLLAYLRYFGIDTMQMPQGMLWHDIINLATSEERFILTSKMKLTPNINFPQTSILEIGKVIGGISIIRNQIINIIKHFNIVVHSTDLLSRCIRCNGLELRQVSLQEISDMCNGSTSSKDVVDCHYRYGSDDEDCDGLDNFLSDSDDDSCLYQSDSRQSKTWLTSKGIPIEIGDVQKISKAQKPATLCESCGKLYWDEDLTIKCVSEINSVIPNLGKKL